MAGAIEKAIRESDLGLNPPPMGDLIRVPMPAADRRAPPRPDEGRAQGRRPRTPRWPCATCAATPTSSAKKLVKDKAISEDDERRGQDEVQKLTDRVVADIDKLLVGQGSGDHDRLMRSHPPAFRHASDTSVRAAPEPTCPATWPSSWMATAVGRRSASCPAWRRPQAGPGRPGARWWRPAPTRGIEYLTVFAFSSENWRRPSDEVSGPDGPRAGGRGVALRGHACGAKGMRVRMVGDREALSDKLRAAWAEAEGATADNTGLTLTVAVQLRRPLGHRSRPCARHRWRASGRCSTRMPSTSCADAAPGDELCAGARTCSSAPAANSASAISCWWQLGVHRARIHRLPVARFRRRRSWTRRSPRPARASAASAG